MEWASGIVKPRFSIMNVCTNNRSDAKRKKDYGEC